MESRPDSGRIKPAPRHRRQVFWQILLPVILTAAGGVVLAVLLSVSAAGGSTFPSQWASIAVIWLLLPLLVFGFLFFLSLAGLIFLLSRMRRGLPTYTHLIHTYLQIINIRVGMILNRTAGSQINALSRWAAWKTFWKQLWRGGRSI